MDQPREGRISIAGIAASVARRPLVRLTGPGPAWVAQHPDTTESRQALSQSARG